MKIRPTDSAPVPPEPEGIKENKKPGFSEIEEHGEGIETPSKARGNKGVSADVLEALRSAGDPKELARRFVDLALSDFGGSLPQGDLEHVRSLLQGQIEEDPFIQGKLERISSLLTKE
jgi:hypothetical protein